MADYAKRSVNDLSAGRLTRRRIDEFIGVCRAMAAKPSVDEGDVRVLDGWLSRHSSLEDLPLVDEVVDTVEWAFEDEFKTKALAAVQEAVRALVGGTGVESSAPTSLPLDEPPPEVSFYGKLFCLTGRFLDGTRRECEEKIRQRGGATTSSMRAKVDYLVIGSKVNETWVHSSFGTKIADAVAWQRKGYSISIISESHWKRHLDAAPRTGPKPPDPPALKPPKVEDLMSRAYDRFDAGQINDQELDALFEQIVNADKTELLTIAEGMPLAVGEEKKRRPARARETTRGLLTPAEANTSKRTRRWPIWPLVVFLISFAVVSSQLRDRSDTDGPIIEANSQVDESGKH